MLPALLRLGFLISGTKTASEFMLVADNRLRGETTGGHITCRTTEAAPRLQDESLQLQPNAANQSRQGPNKQLHVLIITKPSTAKRFLSRKRNKSPPNLFNGLVGVQKARLHAAESASRGWRRLFRAWCRETQTYINSFDYVARESRRGSGGASGF